MATKKATTNKSSKGKTRSLAEMHRRGREDGDAARVISLPKKAK